MLYDRPNQIVGREIVIFIKNNNIIKIIKNG